VGNTAFIFEGALDESSNQFPHITLNLETLESSNPLSYLPDFVADKLRTKSVTSTRDEIYILGGYASEIMYAVMKMNSTTQSYTPLRINNIPLGTGNRWGYAPTGVWVEKPNRNYHFGRSQTQDVEQQLMAPNWYIDWA